MGRMERRRSGTHPTDDENPKQLARLVGGEKQHRAAAPRHAGEQRSENCHDLPGAHINRTLGPPTVSAQAHQPSDGKRSDQYEPNPGPFRRSGIPENGRHQRGICDRDKRCAAEPIEDGMKPCVTDFCVYVQRSLSGNRGSIHTKYLSTNLPRSDRNFQAALSR